VPSGSYQIEIFGVAVPPLYALALSQVPPGPWSFDDLLPYILPYAGVAPVLQPGESWIADDPLGAYNAVVSFVHPSGQGPLTIGGVVLVWMTDPPLISGGPVGVGPITSPGPGYQIDISLYRSILTSLAGG
jgi:hypothetical protein